MRDIVLARRGSAARLGRRHESVTIVSFSRTNTHKVAQAILDQLTESTAESAVVMHAMGSNRMGGGSVPPQDEQATAVRGGSAERIEPGTMVWLKWDQPEDEGHDEWFFAVVRPKQPWMKNHKKLPKSWNGWATLDFCDFIANQPFHLDWFARHGRLCLASKEYVHVPNDGWLQDKNTDGSGETPMASADDNASKYEPTKNASVVGCSMNHESGVSESIGLRSSHRHDEEQFDDETELAVESIVDMRVRNAKRTSQRREEFKVRWSGYTAEDDTWEPLSHLENALDMVRAFKKKKTEEKLADQNKGAQDAQVDETEDGEEDDEFGVEAILDKRIRTGRSHNKAKSRGESNVEYLVRWDGYGPDGDTWEPNGNLSGASELIAAFEKSRDSVTDVSGDKSNGEQAAETRADLHVDNKAYESAKPTRTSNRKIIDSTKEVQLHVESDGPTDGGDHVSAKVAIVEATSRGTATGATGVGPPPKAPPKLQRRITKQFVPGEGAFTSANAGIVRRAFTERDIFEAKDMEDIWYAALVRRREGARRLVHYVGWSDDFDKWHNTAEMMSRTRPLGKDNGEVTTGPRVKLSHSSNILRYELEDDESTLANDNGCRFFLPWECGCVPPSNLDFDTVQVEGEEKQPVKKRITFKKDDLVEARDPSGTWYAAIIRAFDGESRVVHYLGWPRRWDETMDQKQMRFRLRPITKTPRTGPANRTNDPEKLSCTIADEGKLPTVDGRPAPEARYKFDSATPTYDQPGSTVVGRWLSVVYAEGSYVGFVRAYNLVDEQYGMQWLDESTSDSNGCDWIDDLQPNEFSVVDAPVKDVRYRKWLQRLSSRSTPPLDSVMTQEICSKAAPIAKRIFDRWLGTKTPGINEHFYLNAIAWLGSSLEVVPKSKLWFGSDLWREVKNQFKTLRKNHLAQQKSVQEARKLTSSDTQAKKRHKPIHQNLEGSVRERWISIRCAF